VKFSLTGKASPLVLRGYFFSISSASHSSRPLEWYKVIQVVIALFKIEGWHIHIIDVIDAC
jgi:hypothetical protein